MRHNYVFLPSKIDKVTTGNNKDQAYVSGRMFIEGMEEDSRGIPFTFFEQDFPKLVAKYRSVFPKGSKYHGTSEAASEADWDADYESKYEEAMQLLINGKSILGKTKNWLLFPNGDVVEHELESPMFLTFSQNMQGRNGKQYAKGDFVPKNGSKYYRIDYKLKVFTRYETADEDNPVTGFEVETVMRNQLANRKLVSDCVYNEDGSINVDVLKHIDPVDLHTLNGPKYNFNLPDITGGKTGGTPKPENVHAAVPTTSSKAPEEAEAKPAEVEEGQEW